MNDQVLVRAHAAVAGGPPRGQVGFVSRDLYEAASRSGKLESLEHLSSRVVATDDSGAADYDPKSEEAANLRAKVTEAAGDDPGVFVTSPTGPHSVVELYGDKPDVDPDHPSVP